MRRNFLTLNSIMIVLRCVIVGTAFILPLAVNAAPIRMTFDGQLEAICAEIKEKVAIDPKLRGQKLRFTQINSTIGDRNASSSVLKVESMIQGKLKDILDPKSDSVLKGEVGFIESESDDNQGFHVLQIKLVVASKSGRELFETEREINESSDINSFLQTTVFPKDTKDFAERNKQVEEAVDSPSFAFVPGSKTQVMAVGQPKYAVEILRLIEGSGKPLPVPVIDEDGQAFAPVNIGDAYEIALYNFDAEFDAVAKVEIDGLDVVNQFKIDEPDRQFPGYFVPRNNGDKPTAHTIPGWFHTAKKREGKPNVFRFVVNKLGEGVASELGLRSNIGAVTVRFFDAADPGTKLRSRNFGETGRGEGLSVDYDVKPVDVADQPVSIITIRYSRAPK